MIRFCAKSAKKRRAFSLIELLAVITIMGLLMGMIVTASVVVARKQRAASTQKLLLKLDHVLEEYLAQRNVVPAFVPAAYATEVPVPRALRSWNGVEYPDQPDVSVFLRSARGVGQCDTLIASIPEQFLRVTPEGIVTAVDSWAEWPETPYGLIYYVHPDNHLAQALYGRCVNKRPYFLSAGPDGHFGHPQEIAESGIEVSDMQEQVDLLNEWRSDNTYSIQGVDTELRLGRALFQAVVD